MRKKAPNGLNGYSLFELMVVMVLIGLVLSAGYTGLVTVKSWAERQKEESERTTARLRFLARFKKDLYEADRAYASPASDRIGLRKEGRTVRYDLGEDRARRSVLGGEAVSFRASFELEKAWFREREQGGSERPFDRVRLSTGEGEERLSFAFRKAYGAKALMELKER